MVNVDTLNEEIKKFGQLMEKVEELPDVYLNIQHHIELEKKNLELLEELELKQEQHNKEYSAHLLAMETQWIEKIETLESSAKSELQRVEVDAKATLDKIELEAQSKLQQVEATALSKLERLELDLRDRIALLESNVTLALTELRASTEKQITELQTATDKQLNQLNQKSDDLAKESKTRFLLTGSGILIIIALQITSLLL